MYLYLTSREHFLEMTVKYPPLPAPPPPRQIFEELFEQNRRQVTNYAGCMAEQRIFSQKQRIYIEKLRVAISLPRRFYLASNFYKN